MLAQLAPVVQVHCGDVNLLQENWKLDEKLPLIDDQLGRADSLP